MTQKKPKHLLLIIVTLILLVIGVVFGYSLYQVDHFFDSVQDKEKTKQPEETTNVLDTKGPISILLLGIDERPDDPGRADTIIVGTLNPYTKDTHLVSIPRDTLITLPDTTDQLDKINATYMYGGMPEVIEAVEELLDIPIHFYAKLNFEGFVDLIDVVDGIDVVADFPFTVSGSPGKKEVVIEEGPQHLNGEDALGYARMRKQDPRGDFGRQDRQREVIQSLMDELISLDSIPRFASILQAIQPNLSTNIQLQQALSIANQYQPASKTIHESTIPGQAESLFIEAYNQEVYVWNPNDDSLQELQETLQRHLMIKYPDYAPVTAEPLPL